MNDKRPSNTGKIVLPKNLQREMIKFFAQAATRRNDTQDKDKPQATEK